VPDRIARLTSPGIGGRVAAGAVVAFLVLFALHSVVPQPGGPLALTEIAEPLLVVVALLLVPFGLRQPIGRAAAILLLAFIVVRYGPGLVSVPVAREPAPDLRVVSWNLRGNATSTTGLLDRLATTDANVVALQELSREQAAAIEADPGMDTRFPHRILKPEGRLEMGLLSAFPIVAKATSGDPKTIEAVVDRGALGHLAVINVHPLPRGIVTAGPIPVGFDGATRDAELATVRERVDRLAADGTPVLLVGDLDLTEREPAYRDLADGLLDAQLEVGGGWGGTWRPYPMRQLSVGLLRIDYVLSTPDLVPIAFQTDCTPRGGDHCDLWAALRTTRG
jgi:endonuclease/exonuclease/phosphatase (EEP) superfamily protein YafD